MSERIISKTCRVCKETKSLFKFNKRGDSKDGHRNDCKVCQGKQDKQYAQTERGKIAHRKAWRRYNGTEKYKVAHRRYRNSETCKAYNKYYRNKGKGRASDAVNHAIRDGQLPRPDTLQCHYCPAQAEQYHHWSYLPEHWLDVEPVCIKCHTKLHKVAS